MPTPRPKPGAPSAEAAPADRTAAMPPTREAILEAAQRVFLAQGFGGTSMDLVAKEAGVARRTVYNQFAGKEALFRATVEHIWRSFPKIDIATDEAALTDPELGLTRLARGIVEFWAPPVAVAFLRMVIAEGPHFPDLVRNFVEAKAPAHHAVVVYLEALVRRKLLALPDARLAARQFAGMLNEPLLWSRVVGVVSSPTPKEQGKVIDGAVALFLARYGTQAGGKS